jgi:hypothetical protein
MACGGALAHRGRRYLWKVAQLALQAKAIRQMLTVFSQKKPLTFGQLESRDGVDAARRPAPSSLAATFRSEGVIAPRNQILRLAFNRIVAVEPRTSHKHRENLQ